VLLAVAAGLLAGGCGSSAPSDRATTPRHVAARSHAPRAPAAPPIPLPRSDGRLLGQRIMVGLRGTRPSAALLGEVRAGDVGAVILFGDNIVSRGQTLALTGALQRAARAGHNPRLLIATDQEGGEVKRLPGDPPTLSPPQITATGSVGTARGQGRATGAALRRWGIGLDLAPVADVPTTPRSFIAQQGRAFSTNAATAARYASAFAAGLQSARVAATAKHFPGLGSALIDTDDVRREQLRPTAAQRAAALKPYETMIPGGVDAIMAADGGYPAYDPSGTVAALSKPIIGGLLRGTLHYGGVVITDSLGSNTGHDERSAGVLAAAAGADVLLFTDGAPGELAALRAALRQGRIGRSAADASYRRIVALKGKLGLA
jgi:beta-N-acetylhexosaminidase